MEQDQPLLPVVVQDDHEQRCKPEPLETDRSSSWQSARSFLECTFNLAKAIAGAGMMAIPRAYTQIGSLLGTGMLLGVAVLTYWTLAVLITGTSSTGARTYPRLVSVTLGPSMAKLLQVAVLSFCAGFDVVYLVVIKDILLGTPPNCNGLLCEMFGVANSGPWANPAYIICCVALACAPLLLLRSMDKLSVFNIIGVAATVLLATAAAALGVISILQGTAHPVPLLPQWQLLGPTTAAQLKALTDVLPVMLACYVAHQNLHPVMPLLKPYSPGRMCGVVAAALALVACVFFMLAVGGALAFGPDLDINVLKNFTQAGMAPFVGSLLARILSWAIRGGYLIALLANFLLYMHPLRSYVAEVLWPDDSGHTDTSRQPQQQQQQSISSGRAVDSHETRQRIEGINMKGLQGISASTAGNEVSAADSTAVCGSVIHGGGAMTAAAGQCQQTLFTPAPGQTTMEQQSGASTHVAAVAGATKNTITATHEVGAAAAAPAEPLRWQRNEQYWYYPMTYGLLLLLTLLATCVPNIWLALSAIGDLATTIQAFVIPGLIALALAARSKRQHSRVNGSLLQEVSLVNDRASAAGSVLGRCGSNLGLTAQLAQDVVCSAWAWFVVILGSALFVNGVWQRI